MTKFRYPGKYSPPVWYLLYLFVYDLQMFKWIWFWFWRTNHSSLLNPISISFPVFIFYLLIYSSIFFFFFFANLVSKHVFLCRQSKTPPLIWVLLIAFKDCLKLVHTSFGPWTVILSTDMSILTLLHTLIKSS